MAVELPPELASLADPALAPARAAPAAPAQRDLVGRFGLGVTALGGFRDRFSRTAREDEIEGVLSRVTLEGTGRPVRKNEIAWAYNCVDGLVFQLRDGPMFGVRTRG
jgi:hypothetical protein